MQAAARPNPRAGRTAFAAVAFLALSGCGSSDQLSSSQLRRTFAGNTVQGMTDRGQVYTIYYVPDGTAVVRSGNYIDTGTWRVRNDELCTKWRKNGDESCGPIVKHGEGYRVDRDDENKPFLVRRGNYANM